ncbi:MAG: F-box protein [Acidobacteria bacterium]|nr:F-box protein [Acidobacteriota bacterium]
MDGHLNPDDPSMTRIFPLADWAAQETVFDSESAPAPNLGGGQNPLINPNAPGGSEEPRPRRMSLGNLLRPQRSLVANTDDDFSVAPLRREALPEIRAGPPHWHAQERTEDASGLRGMMRRASTSLREKMHRRPGLNMSVSDMSPERPNTAHATWHRLRQAASFRRPKTPFGGEPDGPTGDAIQEDSPAALPVPSIGGEPPIIPHNTGGAAKASVALQNEHLFAPAATPPAQNNRLPFDECNDLESGIGINLAGSVSSADLSSKRASSQNSISRVDFVTRLPTELAIQVLSHLDCAGLLTASRVSCAWRGAVANGHIWRESFLREKTATYATSGPVVPGAGLGVPDVKPTNDWREIYLAREELDRRWRRGEARPVYLNGHLDSIYCLQFDECVAPEPYLRRPEADSFTDTRSSRGRGTRRSACGTCTRLSASSSSGPPTSSAMSTYSTTTRASQSTTRPSPTTRAPRPRRQPSSPFPRTTTPRFCVCNTTTRSSSRAPRTPRASSTTCAMGTSPCAGSRATRPRCWTSRSTSGTSSRAART